MIFLFLCQPLAGSILESLVGLEKSLGFFISDKDILTQYKQFIQEYYQ